jgi:hypothetical protein
LDADFGNVLRFPPADTPGVLRIRVHPATEPAIDGALRRVVALLEGISLRGKLAVTDESRIRIRG